MDSVHDPELILTKSDAVVQEMPRRSEASLERLELLASLCEALYRCATVGEVSDHLIALGRTTLGARDGMLLLPADDPARLEPLRSAAIFPEQEAVFPLPPETLAAAAEAMRSGELQCVTAPPESDPLPALLAFHPLILGAERCGCLVLRFDSAHAIPEEDRRWLRAVARVAALALARLREREATRQARLEAGGERWSDSYRLLMEYTGEAVCGLDLQGRIVFLNPVAARLLQLDPGSARGQSLHALTHVNPAGEDMVPEPDCAICRCLRAEQASHVPHEVFWRPDGSSFPVEYSTIPMREAGQVVGTVLTFSDLTARRLHEQEMLYAVASAQCLLWYADVQYVPAKDRMRWFLWPVMNAEALHRFLPIATGEGQTFAEAFYASRLEEDRPRTDAYGQQEILAGRSYRQEYRCRLANGEIRWISEVVRVEGLARHRWRAVGVCTDITELKRHQQQIEELNLRLRRAMAETHHRVKNNLQAISALVEMQTMREEAMIPVGELLRLGQHIRGLAAIHDLLTREARTTGEIELVSAKEALTQLMPLLKGMVGSRRIRCRVSEMRLPIRQGTSLIVLVNELVSNAIKHGQGDIGITLTVRGDQARLAVRDDGEGFPPDFDPRRAASTGLELVESVGRWDMQGVIQYQNLRGGGAQVVVTFPVHHLLSGEEEPEHAER